MFQDNALAKFSSRSFSLLLVQDGEVGNSCLPFLSMNRLECHSRSKQLLISLQMSGFKCLERLVVVGTTIATNSHVEVAGQLLD